MPEHGEKSSDAPQSRPADDDDKDRLSVDDHKDRPSADDEKRNQQRIADTGEPETDALGNESGAS